MLVGISAGTTVLDVVVDGRPAVKALIREIQRDSVRPAEILHLDLYEVRADEKVTLSVPVHLIGIPDGVRNFGGVLDHSLRELEIEVLPADIPEHVELDVTNLTIGHSLFVRDIQHREGRDPQRARHAGLHRGGAAGRRGAGGGGGGGGPGRAGADPEAEAGGRGRGRSRVEGLGSAHDRGAGKPRPGVRGHPAQRRVPPRRSIWWLAGSWRRSAVAIGLARPREPGRDSRSGFSSRRPI